MIWLIVSVILVAGIHFWRTYRHPVNQLGQQAAKLGWVAAGSIKDKAGFRNTILRRGNHECQILFNVQKIRLTKPLVNSLFDNIVDVEEWLTNYVLGDDEKDPEILYYRAIEKYIRSLGNYQPLLELQGTDEDYYLATMDAQKAAFQAKVSEKVAGALILDSMKHYLKSRELAFAFLERLKQRWLGKKPEVTATVNNTSQNPTQDDDPDDYHPDIDREVEKILKLFDAPNDLLNLEQGNGLSLKLNAELIVYAGTYLAMMDVGEKINQMAWNTFKRSIENRLLSIADDGSQRSGLVSTPNGIAFTHSTSGYWGLMDKIDELVDSEVNLGRDPKFATSKLVYSMLGGNPINQEEFECVFADIIDIASKTIFPKVERVFT